MEWHDIKVDGRHTEKFADLPYVPLTNPPQSPDTSELLAGKKLGGILRRGEWAWVARNSVLQINSLRNGQTISNYEFCESRGYESCCIKCVEEIFPNNPEVMLLAVVLESFRAMGGGCSYVAIYSVELSSVLNSIELSLHITCARFMDATACRRTLLQNFDGCLSVGSEEGVIVLLDLNMRKLLSMHNEMPEDKFAPCHIVDYSLSLTEIHRNFLQCQKDGIHFGLQMEVIESPCRIQCILPVDLILGLAIGLEDGRLALYDLAELQIFYVALPNLDVAMSALVKMDFLEPPDDPRPCLYIWTLHENCENLHAVLHSLMYEKRIIEDDDSTYFETFQNSSVRLQLPLEATRSVALSCQAISTLPNHGEDDSISLCGISWLSVLEGKNKLLVFDLNQWYKEEMPFMLEYGKQPNYLAGYILNGECTGLHTLLNQNNIAHFNSMQRFEEHFYPNSLSFEGLLLHTEGCRRYNWEGAQNRVINLLRSSNAAIFLEPNLYFNEIIRTRLMPQFIELNMNATFSRNAKYEILLSVALEHNCVSLLRDCAKSWIDGSFMGNFAASTGLSLSTLTDWIWKRATCIKSRCNDQCKSLFVLGGYRLDHREQKELGFITRQLKLLSDLLKEILVYAKKQIPERVWHDLENKHRSLCMASSYQDILLWLLNIGLLPEASPHNDKANTGNDLIPYPYNDLKEFYTNKRSFFSKINETFISKKSGSCKLLFIDSFIEHVCKGNVLHEYWMENDGNGLYPPDSLEAMLRVMLVPDLDYDNKCAILLYFFLDLNMAIDEEVYKDVATNFIKFPSVFKLSAPLIKTVQAFWNLDHGQYLAAIDEFISPFNKNQCYPQWQVELLIEVLLNQQACNLALRVLESQPSLVSPLLKLNTLLANGLISEAFHFVRSKNDDMLLETFFTCCLRNGQFGVIRDLALSEREGLILQNILKQSKAPGAESLHFVYLLQKSKYIEAVSYMDELSNKAKSLKTSLHQASQMETPNLVLSAFNTTMTPVTQGLTDVYFRIKNKIKKKEVDNKSPVPLSCQLIKQNANSLLGGIYHSSALSAHFATYYWGEMEEQTKQVKHLLNSNNAPFLRKPQIDTNCIEHLAKNNISYPQAYKVTEKRTLVEIGVMDNGHDDFERQKIELKLNPRKKRRLIGQEIVDGLSHFMKMHKTPNSLNASEFTFGQEESSEPLEQTRKNSLDLLTKPVKRGGKEFEDVAASEPEIHSILKSHTPEPGHLQRVPPVEEEKNLRFRLPSADVNTSPEHIESMQSEDTTKHIEIAQEETSTSARRKPSSLISSAKFKTITRAVSEESNKSSVSSSNISEEDFYSPLSSQNNSKLDCSNLSIYSYISGPQPRKPLARFSAERSEKSLTPEPETKTTSSPINKSSPLEYVAAVESDFKTKISPRSSIKRLSADHLGNTNTTDESNRNESNNAAYVTATEAFSNPLTFSSSNSKEEVTQTISDCGSIASRVTFVGSKINEFVPKVSSSKVGTSPIKAVGENQQQTAKLSECSTVLGSLTTFEYSTTSSNNVFSMPSIPSDKTESCADLGKPSDEQKRQMLETTLSMSTYDISILDSTSLQQAKSSLMVTAKDVTLRYESTKLDENKKIELEEKENEEMECKEQLEENKDDSEQQKEYEEIEIQKQSNTPVHREESNYDCIVLSSSSSEDHSDYEREEVEDEIDNDDNIAEDENAEFEESKDSDMSFDDVEDDYDEDDNNEELSIEQTDNLSDAENDDDIQLIEDSSSDVREQQASYGESDSDDVKLIEDEQTPFAPENIELLVSEGEPKTESTSNIGTDEKANVNERKIEKETDVEIMASIINKSPSLQANKIEKADTNSSENPNELSVIVNNPQQIDIRNNENVGTSITEVITEIKSEILKQEDIMDKSFCGGQEEQHRETESDPKDAISAEIEVTLPKSKEHTKSNEFIKTTEETTSLRMKDSVDAFEVKVKEQLEVKATTEKKASTTVAEKSVVVVDIETKSSRIAKTEELKMQEIEDGSRHIPALYQPPVDTELKAVEVKSIAKEKTAADKVEEKSQLINNKEKMIEEDREKEVLKEKKIEDCSASTSTPTKQSILRESSGPPMDLKLNAFDVTSTTEEIVTDKEQDKSVLTIEQYKISEKNEELKEKDKLQEKSELIVEEDTNICDTDKKELKVKEIKDDSTTMSTPRKHRTLTGSDMTPINIELNTVGVVSSPRRNTRGISVPPQTVIESEDVSNLTPRTRRSKRASSLQPKYKMEDTKTGPQFQDSEYPETRATRGSSLPPGAVDGKIPTRSRSVLLDAINENDVILDSPSTRTRLRSRLNSIDSELDSSVFGSTDQLMQPKRTRRRSMSNNPMEQPQTPKRTRRNSNNSQPEASAAASTPRSLRSHSVLTVQEEDTESIPDSPKPVSSKRIGMKRKKSSNEEPTTESQEHIDKISPKSDKSLASEASYSLSRRLTRTQLAIMEKSTALSQASTSYAVAKEAETISPPLNKRSTKSRSTRSSNVTGDSDDAESVSSKLSTASSVTGTKRRVTRSSLKEKDDDDDRVSVASSFGSEKHQKHRRSKDKSSPNTTLSAIPEEAPVEIKKRGRPTLKH